MITQDLDLSEHVLTEQSEQAIKTLINQRIWDYYHQREGDVIFRKFFVAVRFRDIKFIFSAIAGPEPT
jgi:hypothetical protein